MVKRVAKPTTERLHYQSKKISKTTSEKKPTPAYSKMKSEQLAQHEALDSRGKPRTVYCKQKSQIVCVDQVLEKAGEQNMQLAVQQMTNLPEDSSPNSVPVRKQYNNKMRKLQGQ